LDSEQTLKMDLTYVAVQGIISINKHISRNHESILTKGKHIMLLKFAKYLLKREQKIPETYLRMVRAEYRSVPLDYVEYFLAQNKRLPSPQELLNAI
jgi:hypothetical protein